MPKHPEPQTIFPGENAQHREVMAALTHIGQRLDAIEQGQVKLMAKVDDEAAAVAANTAALKTISATVTSLSEGHSSISDEIADLKAQIAAGQAPDFTALDAAVADQTATIQTLTTQVPAAPGT